MSQLQELQEKEKISIATLKEELSGKYPTDEPNTTSVLIATSPTVNWIKIMIEIEAVAQKILCNLAENKPMTSCIQNNTSWENTNFNEKLRSKSGNDSALTKVNFNDVESRKKFSMIYLLFSVIHKLLDTDEKSNA
ncbi:hypothetical protein CBL_21511, partial [Carabus blaptoides fortunei]